VQVQQGVQLHCCLVLTKLGPGKEGEAEVNGGRIQSVQTLIQLHSYGIVSIQRACDRDQSLRKVRVDSPVPGLIGIGQSGTCDGAAKTHVIEFAADRSQASLDITETLAVRQLREGHGEKLTSARQVS